MSGTRNEGGVSFRDVAECLRDIRSRRGGYLCFTIALADRRNGNASLSIVLEHREHVVLAKCSRHARKVWAEWPSTKHRTFAGLLFDLCYRIDAEMDAVEQLAQQSMPI